MWAIVRKINLTIIMALKLAKLAQPAQSSVPMIILNAFHAIKANFLTLLLIFAKSVLIKLLSIHKIFSDA